MKAISSVTAFALASACFVLNAADINLYWRGSSDNPDWDYSTANWQVNGSGDLIPYSYVANSTYAIFDGSGAKDVMVDAGGVTTFALRPNAGSHVLHGGNVKATYVFPYGGNLTICNTVQGSVYMRGGSLTVGDGGYLKVDGYYPDVSTESGLASRLTVSTGGVMRVNIDTSRVSSKYSTLCFDGGTLVHPAKSDVKFVNSRIVLGPGGMHVKDEPSADYTYIPGPIGSDTENDGGLWIEDHASYLLLPNYASTYRGGLHILGSKGWVAVRDDSHLGAVPASPANGIFFANNASGSSSLLVSHGNVVLSPNRGILISDGMIARLGSYNASNAWRIRSAITCEPAGKGKLSLEAFSAGAAAKPIAIETEGGRTNRLGALLVKAPAIIGSGTTLVEGGSTYTGSSGDSAVMNISGNGHLTVTGGVVRLLNGGYVCNGRQLTVSGGTVDFSAASEFLNAAGAAATTTVSRTGRMIVNILRVGESSKTTPSAAVIRLEDGGVLQVNKYLWVGTADHKGALDFDGGLLDWASDRSTFVHPSYAALGPQYEGTKVGLAVLVREGGMVVSNDKPLYVEQSIQSGATADGGITKWGADELALQNGTNTFNGPVRVMQGSFAVATGLRNAIDTNATVCVNAGARFRMNGAYHVFARIEGGGEYAGMVDHNLTVREAIAPGMGPDALGTLTVTGGACKIADGVALEIDVDADGNSDCLNYPATLDLSKLTLRVSDLSKLNADHRYVIAILPQGAVGEFRSTNLTDGWKVRYLAASHELVLLPPRGMSVIIR